MARSDRTARSAAADRKRCHVSGKIVYASASEARRRSRKVGDKIFTYRCQHCGAIHITSSGTHADFERD